MYLSIHQSIHPIDTSEVSLNKNVQVHLKTYLFISLSVRWESSRLSLWSGAPGQDVSQRDPVQRVLDWTQLWYHQLRQHPVCGAYCVSVHHHGGLGRHPLQRESIYTKDTRKGTLLFVVKLDFLAVCLFSTYFLHQQLQFYHLRSAIFYSLETPLDQHFGLWHSVFKNEDWISCWYSCFSEDEPYSNEFDARAPWNDLRTFMFLKGWTFFSFGHLMSFLLLPSSKCQRISLFNEQIASICSSFLMLSWK